jgi:PPOX class probable F420-dependent enzyme
VTTTEEGLAAIRAIAPAENWLAVLVTTRPDGEPAVSVVNAGILPHPRTGDPVVALVSRGGTAKLRNLRARPHATLVFRSGWQWVGVSGPVELAGPDDPGPGQLGPDGPRLGLDAEELRVLLRDIYTAAGGQHPDLDEYDRDMVADRRAAVLITPARFHTNPR